MAQQTLPKKITRKELAAHLGLSLRTVDNLVTSGRIPYLKLGRAVRFDLSEVEAALREKFTVTAKA